jgi:hypothetical protein
MAFYNPTMALNRQKARKVRLVFSVQRSIYMSIMANKTKFWEKSGKSRLLPSVQRPIYICNMVLNQNFLISRRANG